eukprot:11435911-Alexandrium_andersonii.AAC.1
MVRVEVGPRSGLDRGDKVWPALRGQDVVYFLESWEVPPTCLAQGRTPRGLARPGGQDVGDLAVCRPVEVGAGNP